MTEAFRVTVGIATRNRPEALARCIASLAMLGDLLGEVIVIDDGSTSPVEAPLRAALDAAMSARTTVVRVEPACGMAAARNMCVERSRDAWVLHLDDDTVMLTRDAVASAVETIAADATIFAIAFAQAYADGTPLPPAAQPAPVAYPCQAASYIGFAHLVRRDAFLALGGYQSLLVIHGEERELCLRALDAGYRVVFLPDARVAHLADPSGRDLRHYLHLTVRNGVLASILDDPLPLLLVRVPLRLRAYFTMRRGWKLSDPGGWRTVLGWIRRDLRRALAARRPVRWSTIRRWRRLTREQPRYEGPR